jgi:hypothetical protein
MQSNFIKAVAIISKCYFIPTQKDRINQTNLYIWLLLPETLFNLSLAGISEFTLKLTHIVG